MSESETQDEPDAAEAERTGQLESCQRCGREQGLVGKYDIWLCRQCFREIARGMGFEKYS
ncbi:30S ribosomal protein S14 [Haloarcula litorea]|uniref:30S ribosomal protein S14 n=1 Tax=Haloarcula litorea TaxID=3032579 RepID=UPI0023E830DE|nr:30S ribosomal protein S14 [Halomicroarcula sp. GDY20]